MNDPSLVQIKADLLSEHEDVEFELFAVRQGVAPESKVFDEDYKAVYAEFYTPYFNQFVRAILRAVREGRITPDQIHEVRYNTSLIRIRDQVPHLITPEQVCSGLSKIAANENAREMALSAAIVATKELLGE